MPEQTGTSGVYRFLGISMSGGMKCSSSDVRKPKNCLQCPPATSLANTSKSSLCVSVGWDVCSLQRLHTMASSSS